MPCGYQTDARALSHQQISLLSSSEVITSLPAIVPLLCHLPGSVRTAVQMRVSTIVPSSMTILIINTLPHFRRTQSTTSSKLTFHS